LQRSRDSNVAFSIFDGDLKAGGDGPCSDSLYTTAIAGFNTLERPLVWLPGDNDWTDCWGRYGLERQLPVSRHRSVPALRRGDRRAAGGRRSAPATRTG